MKKKITKKLELKKETLRNLEQLKSLEELAMARGGASGISCDTGCYEPTQPMTKWC